MSDELKAEYQFDYKKAKPNRFAAGLHQGGQLVVLEPEVALAFPAAAKKALKGLIETLSASDDQQ